MNMILLENLMKWPRPYISGTDLHHILDKSANSRFAIVKRAIQSNLLLPIRRDLYIIKLPKQPLVNLYELSSIIYGPSYVSFESALSFHGWIPEAVQSTTCATLKRSKEFGTPIGTFTYEHIPVEAFPIFIEQLQQKDVTLFIASPWKALADFIYARKRLWSSVEDLSEDLRIEVNTLKNSDKIILKDLMQHYPSPRVQETLANLYNGLLQ